MRNIIEQSVLPSVSSATSLRCHVMGGTQTKDQGVQRSKELFDHSDVGRCHGGIGFQVGVEEWIGKGRRHAIIRD